MIDGWQSLRGVLMLACLAIFVLVFAVMLVSIWQHHRSGDRGQTNFHGSVAVELSWSLAPFVIVLLLVWPAVRSLWGF